VFDASSSQEGTLPIDEYRWYVDGIRQYSQSGPRAVFTADSYGIFTVDLEVEGEGGKLSRTTAEVQIGDEADIIDNPEFTLDRRAPSEQALRLGVGDFRTFAADIRSSSVPIADAQLIINGELMDSFEVTSSNIQFESEFNEPGMYRVNVQLIDAAGKADTVSWDVAVTGRQPSITSTSPSSDDLLIKTGSTQQFAIDAEVSDGTIDYVWSVDGAPAGSGATFERTFSRPGEYEIAVTASTDVTTSASHNWRIDVQSFRAEPEVTGQSSNTEITPNQKSNILTFSVRNPEVNQQTMAVEIAASLPDGVSITSAEDVSEGDAGIQALIGEVRPGRQESMRLVIEVSDSFHGESITIPYQIQYYPSQRPDEYRVVQNTSVNLNVSGVSQSNTPGFGIPITILTLCTLALLAREFTALK
jgi:hypothetical protein